MSEETSDRREGAASAESRIDAGPVPLRRIFGRDDLAMPALGFGTWELRGSDAARSVEAALQVGYRHIDTARIYQNEEEVGHGIRAAGVEREAFWLTSKVWFENLSPAGIRRQTEESLSALRVDFLDLMLIHWPNPKFDLRASLEALAVEVERGTIRSFGVSNFPAALFREALEIAPDVVTDQVEHHVFLGQERLREIARDRGNVVTAYSPLGQGLITRESDTLQEIAAAHGKSPAQIALRWLLDQPEVAAIPRSKNPDHIAENFRVFDFELSAEETDRIDRLPKSNRQVAPDWAPQWD